MVGPRELPQRSIASNTALVGRQPVAAQISRGSCDESGCTQPAFEAAQTGCRNPDAANFRLAANDVKPIDNFGGDETFGELAAGLDVDRIDPARSKDAKNDLQVGPAAATVDLDEFEATGRQRLGPPGDGELHRWSALRQQRRARAHKDNAQRRAIVGSTKRLRVRGMEARYQCVGHASRLCDPSASIVGEVFDPEPIATRDHVIARDRNEQRGQWQVVLDPGRVGLVQFSALVMIGEYGHDARGIEGRHTLPF